MIRRTNRIYYRLGCRKDPEDLRDIPMGLVLPPVAVPKRIDYTSRMTPVRQQGDEGTCVAFASAVGVKEYQDSQEYKKFVGLSPRYLYAKCKAMDGIPDEEGTYPRVAMKALTGYGVCLESFWPYAPHQSDKPKAGADKDAKRYRIRAYARLTGIGDMKRSLSVNGPFLAGVEVYDNWFTPKVERTGLIPMPKSSNYFKGGHAICVMGYDDKTGRFKFKNSWSTAWGDKGYGYLGYEYIDRYCSDAWSATDLIENAAEIVKAREEAIRRNK